MQLKKFGIINFKGKETNVPLPLFIKNLTNSVMNLYILYLLILLILPLNLLSQSSSLYSSFRNYYSENYVVHSGPGGLAAFDDNFLPGISVGYIRPLTILNLPVFMKMELGYGLLGGKYTSGSRAGDAIVFHSIQPSLDLGYKFSKRWWIFAGIHYSYLLNTNQSGEVLNRNLFSYKIAPRFDLNKRFSVDLFIQPFLTPFFKFPFSSFRTEKEYWRLYGIGINFNFIR